MDDSTANGTQAKRLTPYYREHGIPTISYLSSGIPSPTMVVTPASSRAPSPTLSQESSSPFSTCSSSRPRPSSSSPSSMATLVASPDDTPIPSTNVAIPLTEIAGEDPQWELTAMSSKDILEIISERVDYAFANPWHEDAIHHIMPMTTTFINQKQLPVGWQRCVSPDGKQYFYDATRRIYTHTNLYDCENVSIIEIMAGQVLARLEAHDNCPSDVEVVLHARYDAKEAKMMRGYYLASPSLRCIFWLQRVFVNKVTNAERAAMSEAHLGLAVESHFWRHIWMYPCHRKLAEKDLDELRDIVTYGHTEAFQVEASIFPWDPEMMTHISRCVEKYKVDGDSSYHVCAIGHQMEILRYEMFLHYHGEPAVRGSRTESALPEKGRLRVHTYLFKVFSWIFFGMPTLYLKELRKVWVDETVHYYGWRKFTDALKRDWENSITPATVLLSANVGFLAIQSIDNSPGSVHRSLAQIASYVSAIMSLFNYITVQILSRQHRHYLYETSDATMNFLDRRENQVGLEMVAITISLPTGLFIWSMLTFLLSLSFVFFYRTDQGTQITLGIFLACFVVMTLLLVCMDYGSDEGSASFSELQWTQSLRNRISHIFTMSWTPRIWRRRGKRSSTGSLHSVATSA